MRRWLCSEDGWSVLIAFIVIILGMAIPDAFGWIAKVSEWTDLGKAVAPADAKIPGWASILLTYLFLLVTLGTGIALMKQNVKRFIITFTIVFALAYLGWVLGHYAHVAATPDKWKKLNIDWSLKLTGEAGYLIALAFGLFIGNFLPGVASQLRDASRAELFVKTAIVIVGASLGVKAAEEANRTATILFRGLAAIIEAYLIYWAVVYFIARKWFGFSREFAAPLASGISICGVSAAITTGAAIRARPIVPVMVSSLVVIFSVVELIALPILARNFLSDEPMVAAAWMGLAVKTDGAAISAGAVTESMVYAKAAEGGVIYEPKSMEFTTTTVKIFIDIFIGIWAVVLALVWAYGIERKPGARVPWAEIWDRFPKFVFGYVISFAVIFAICMTQENTQLMKPRSDAIDQIRRVFFVLTFFAIGMSANFRKLWAEGLGKLALVYVVSLFGFVIWFGLLISWLFFQGVMPPLAKGTSP